MKTFKEYLEPLGAEVLSNSPPEEYHSGVGLAAWTLVQIMLDATTPSAARITAIREVADRAEGKSVTAAAANRAHVEELVSRLQIHRLTPEESAELGRLLRIADPERED